MVEKLRRKFIIISVGTVFIVLFVIAGFLNISNYLQMGRNADELLNVLTANDGSFPQQNKQKGDSHLPPQMSPEAPFSTRFFTIKFDESGNPLKVDTGKIFSISTDEAVQYGSTVLKSNKESGFLGDYKYASVEKEYGTLTVFVDCARELQMFRSFLFNSILICLLGITAVFILVLIFSKKAIAPVAQSYEKQRRFITDASHELKTPLAIISANNEFLEMDYGENQWTRSTQNQVGRLSRLVGSLVSLTRMDEEKNQLLKTDFSLTDAVNEGAEPFKAVAKSYNKELILDVDEGISYCGDEEKIRQMVAILLDNAVKYAEENGVITLSLKRQGKKCVLQTINEAPNLTAGNYDVLFERFYRCDNSRNSQTGGYGIGLSICKAIVLQHKGKIKAESPDGNRIIFTVQV